jgi:hypothetical protein
MAVSGLSTSRIFASQLPTSQISTPSKPFASEALSPGGQLQNQAGKKAALGFSRNLSSLAVLSLAENQSWLIVATHSYRFGPDCFANAPSS